MNWISDLPKRAVHARNRARHLLLPRGPDERIFFLHVQKCGGTSIDRAIRKACRGPTAHLDPFASKEASSILDRDMMAYRRELLLYFMAQHRLRYISGHFAYSEAAYQAFGDRWRYITALRHPVDRWLSLYYYNRYKSGSHFKVEEDLETYMNSAPGAAEGCCYVNRFTEGIPLEQQREDAAVEAALETLGRFALVGVLERLGRFADAFEARFGAKIKVRKLNANPAPDRKREEVSATVREEIERICAPDLRIYHAVLEGGLLEPL